MCYVCIYFGIENAKSQVMSAPSAESLFLTTSRTLCWLLLLDRRRNH